MDADEPGWSLIDDFVRGEADGRSPQTVRRYERVRQRLTHYLDTADMAAWLGSGPAALLDAERQFHPEGAFWTLLGADDLVCCLPGFLVQPWLPDGRAEARGQVSMVARLLTHLRRHRLLDLGLVSCALADTESALVCARRRLEHPTDGPDVALEHQVVQEQPGRGGGREQ